MRTEEFHKLLSDPKNVADYLVDDLREMAMKYPYSQIIQLMYGLRLRTSSEHLFNQQLGKTAVLTNDRSVLFELFENKPRTLNAGIETVEVDQLVEAPSIAPVESASPTIASREEVIPVAAESPSSSEPKPETEQTVAKRENVEAPQIPPTPADAVLPSPPPPKPALLSATPENMDGLSPQDRVKAILERNRLLREQFESQKNKGDEMLFSQPSLVPPTENSEAEPSPTSPTSEASEPIEASEATPNSTEPSTVEAAEMAHPSTPHADPVEEERLNQVEELKPAPPEEVEPALKPVFSSDTESKAASEAFSKTESPSDGESIDEPEPWADTPIDIEALIRRRFAPRYKAEEEETEEDLWDEVEPEAPEEEAAAAPEPLEATEADYFSPVVEEEPGAEESTELGTSDIEQAAEEENKEVTEEAASIMEEEPQSDLAMAARIRAIRERLDRLKESDALSKEELQAMMEEHQELEALMAAELPLDEKHLFEVEDKDDLSTVSHSPDPVEVQGEVHIPELQPELPEVSPDQESLPSEASDTKAQETETETEAETEIETETEAPAPAKEEEETLTEAEAFVAETSTVENTEEQTRQEAEAIPPLQVENYAPKDAPRLSLVVETSSTSESGLESSEDEEKASPAEQKELSISSEPQVVAPIETGNKPEGQPKTAEEDLEDINADPDEPKSEEDEVDAEIRRIEALAARLRTGPNREMRQDEINALRERRMEEMIAQRKKSLEVSRSVEKDLEESNLAAEEAKANLTQSEIPSPSEVEGQDTARDSEVSTSTEVEALVDSSNSGDSTSTEVEAPEDPSNSENSTSTEVELPVDSSNSEDSTSTQVEAPEDSSNSGDSTSTEVEAPEDPSNSENSTSTEVELPVDSSNSEDSTSTQVEAPEDSSNSEDSTSTQVEASEDHSEPEASASAEVEAPEDPSNSDDPTSTEVEEAQQGDAETETLAEELEETAKEKASESPQLEPQAAASEAEEVPSSQVEEQAESVLEKEQPAKSGDSSGPSFSEWLKNLKAVKPYPTRSSESDELGLSSASAEAKEDSDETQGAPKVEVPRAEIAEKIELLDAFVEKLPDLKMQSRVAQEQGKAKEPKPTPPENADSEGAGGLVTETLAKVYIRQKHYKKAIQAYQILMLKYPEKSSFFASQISEIKKLDNSK